MAIVFVALALAAAGGAYAWSELVPGPPMTIAIVPADEVVIAPTAQFQFASDIRDARNRVVGTKPDPASGDASRNGFGLVVQYGAHAELGPNHLDGSGVGVFSDSRVSPLP